MSGLNEQDHEKVIETSKLDPGPVPGPVPRGGPGTGTEQEIEVPDGGYGWFVVIAVFLFNFSGWGSTAGYAVYLAHYLDSDVFPGVTKLEYGVIGGLKLSSGMLFAPLLNYTVGQIGIHLVIGIGITLNCITLLLASWATQFWELALTQGFLSGVGICMMTITSISLLPQWFRKKRSLAQGLVSAGSGLGGITFVLGLQRVIAIKNYNWALRVEAIICTVTAAIGLMLTRTRSKHFNPQFLLIDKDCFNLGHLLLILWITSTMLGYVVIFLNLADFTQSLGYSSYQSSIVATMVSLGGLLGRPVVGRICDWYGPISVGIIVHLVVAILSWAMWIPTRNLATAIVFALMEGALMGTIWVTVVPMTTRVVGLSKTGNCLGDIWVFAAAATLVSPVVGLKLKGAANDDGSVDPTQYVSPAIFVGFMYFSASIWLFCLRGWIIARDHILLEQQQQQQHQQREQYEEEFTGLKEDTGAELHIYVPVKLGLKHCFSMKPIRKA